MFEIAVANFVKALDPTANVNHNVKTPDRDTSQPRQRDVWVEAKICGHYPIKILISCKRLKRKLNEQDIDAFVGEFRSSGAHKGVIYSYSGYARYAIEKANKLGISCCRIYSNQPPDLPEAIIHHSYCSASQMNINVIRGPEVDSKLTKWENLLTREIENEHGKLTVLDFLSQTFNELEQKALENIGSNQAFPEDYYTNIEIPDNDLNPLLIEVGLKWNIYEGKIDAYLINGSYSINDNDFKGTQSIPFINMLGPSPGPGWKLLKERPNEKKLPSVNCIMYNQSVKPNLLEFLGPRLLNNS